MGDNVKSKPRSVKVSVFSPQARRDTFLVGIFRLASGLATGALLVNVADHFESPQRGWGLASVCLVFAVVASGCEVYYGGYAARREEKRLRRRVLDHLYSTLGSVPNQPGKAVQLLTDNIERATEYRLTYLGSTLAALTLPFIVLTYVAIAFDPLTGMTVMALVPLIPFLIAGFMRLWRKTSAHSRTERAKLAGAYLDAIRNLVLIRLLGAGPRIEEKLRVQGEANRRAIMRLLAGNQIVIIVLDGLFSLLLVCLTTVLAINRYGAGALTLSQAIAVVLLATLLIEPLVQVAGFFYVGMGGIASTRALKRYLSEGTTGTAVREKETACVKGQLSDARAPLSHEATEDGANSGSSSTTGTGVICVREVSYDYGRGTVLDGVNLRIEAGQRVAIVGPSGAGKSTLLKLMRAALVPSSGKITIAGVDIHAAPQEYARNLTAVVAQQTWLFTGTIADNLRLAQPQATQQQMWEALERAHVRGEVERMPRGLDSEVGERGALISGGQAQRISLARALLSERKILFLDEPTSQVDMQSEAEITAALSELDRDLTIVAVTHRRALAELADVIYEVRDSRLRQVTMDEYE
ncbi:ABC transporter ATP-binding protein/permease [Arcanobacterium canis]|uniref:ABC transporter ATP-binding protein n=1 Tax=Arcanobacterium canis TaxID=999183 RepID=A0ABY8FX48_9ACTO|nr:ABC transporter ATP-binding protein [Arcanobacterium canis]WFM83093.1 ABC transporter ATP-binding protein [Arcanobacterium canis]